MTSPTPRVLWPLRALRLLLLAPAIPSTVGSAAREDVNVPPRVALATHLLKNYNAEVPPHEAVEGWQDSEARTIVSVRFEVHDLKSVDLERGVIKAPAGFVMEWLDPRLSYNGSKWFGSRWRPGMYQTITLPSASQNAGDSAYVWTPKSVALAWSEGFDFLQDSRTAAVTVQEDGTVEWWRDSIANVGIQGQLDLSNFPFDKHSIVLAFETGRYERDQGVRLRVGASSMVTYDMGMYSMKHAHVAIATTVQIWERYWSDHAGLVFNTNVFEELKQEATEDDGDIIFILYNLERIPTYYIVNVICPLLFLLVLQTLSFWIPLESGERLVYSATLFSAIVVFMAFTTDLRPVTTMRTWLDCLQIWCLIVCFIPVLESVLLKWIGKLTQAAASSMDESLMRCPNGQGRILSVNTIDDLLRHGYPCVLIITLAWVYNSLKPWVEKVDVVMAAFSILCFGACILLLSGFVHMLFRKTKTR